MENIEPFFRASRSSVLNCIQTVSEITNLKQTDIFNSFLITENKRRVYLVSSNGEVQIQSSVKHSHSLSLAAPFLVHIKNLTNMLKLTLSETISFVYNKTHLAIFTESTSFHVKTLSVSKFPLFYGVSEECIVLIVNQKVLKQLLKVTFFSIAKHELFSHFNNICVYFRNGRLNCITLDGRRMSYASATLRIYSNSSVTAVMTRSSLSEIYKLLEYTNHLSKLYISRNYLRYTASNSEFICKQVIGSHPNVKYILKKEYLFYLEVERLLLVTALNRLLVLITGDLKTVNLSLKAGRLAIRATNLTAEKLEEVVPIRNYNKHLHSSEVSININYIIELLTNIGFLLVNLLVEDNSKSIMLVHQNTYRHVLVMSKN